MMTERFLGVISSTWTLYIHKLFCLTLQLTSLDVCYQNVQERGDNICQRSDLPVKWRHCLIGHCRTNPSPGRCRCMHWEGIPFFPAPHPALSLSLIIALFWRSSNGVQDDLWPLVVECRHRGGDTVEKKSHFVGVMEKRLVGSAM